MPITKSVRYFVNGTERPGNYALQAGSVVYAEETAMDDRGNTRTFRTNTITVTAPGTASDYTRMQDFNIDRTRVYDFNNTARHVYLPAWEQGWMTVGDPNRVSYTASQSVTLTAGLGPTHTSGRSYYSGSLQCKRPGSATRWGGLVHATRPNAVCAVFSYDDATGKEIDFELTLINGVRAWQPNLWLRRTSGGRVQYGGTRSKVRFPWADRPQRLEAIMSATRCDFYGDGSATPFFTIYPSDYPSDAQWDTTTVCDLFFTIERHESWAGPWDYTQPSEMIVYEALPGLGASSAPAPSPAPAPAPAPVTTGGAPSEVTASRVIAPFNVGQTAARTITHPAATAGNLRVLFVSPDKAAVASLTEGGWTLHASHDTGPGVSGALFSKRAVGGETSIGFTTSNSVVGTAYYTEVRDVNATVPVSTGAKAVINTGTAARTTGEINAGPSDTENQLVLVFASNDSQNNVRTGTSGGWSNDFVEVAGHQRPGTGTASGSGEPFLSVASRVFPTVGTARTTSYTYVGGTADEMLGMLIAINAV